MAKNLIIYYSRKGQNYVNGSIRNLKQGNAERIALYIQEAVGADIFQIETVKSYSEDYMTCTSEAKEELRAKARPELKNYLSTIAEYDNIYIVGPCWWGIYPMAMYTQLEKLDFTGKHVHFIVTHEGSGLGGVPRTMKDACKGAVISTGLAVQGSQVTSSEQEIKEWALNVQR